MLERLNAIQREKEVSGCEEGKSALSHFCTPYSDVIVVFCSSDLSLNGMLSGKLMKS